MLTIIGLLLALYGLWLLYGLLVGGLLGLWLALVAPYLVWLRITGQLTEDLPDDE